jgi:hypothetical protein
MGRSMIKRLVRVALKASERSARVLSTFPQFWHGLLSNRPDRYWPERHYMRGPGPKWREKHAHPPIIGCDEQLPSRACGMDGADESVRIAVLQDASRSRGIFRGR